MYYLNMTYTPLGWHIIAFNTQPSYSSSTLKHSEIILR